MLETIETRWGRVARRVWRAGRAAPPVHLWPLMLTSDAPVLPKGKARSPVVAARVNHGRWQTECPFCPSAQHASPADRVFYCAHCMNAENGHKTLPVKWPKEPDAIDTQLRRRPHPRHRNWDPGETVRDLDQQDEEWRAMSR